MRRRPLLPESGHAISVSRCLLSAKSGFCRPSRAISVSSGLALTAFRIGNLPPPARVKDNVSDDGFRTAVAKLVCLYRLAGPQDWYVVQIAWI